MLRNPFVAALIVLVLFPLGVIALDRGRVDDPLTYVLAGILAVGTFAVNRARLKTR